MKIVAVINSRSGGLANDAAEDLLSQVRESFVRSGIDADIVPVQGEQLAAALEQAARSDVDAIVIGGGDGTVSSALQTLRECDKPLGILPMGTFNLLARDLGMSLDVAQAVAQLAAATPQHIDTAFVNGRVFMCNSTLGLLPPLTQARETQRGRGVLRSTLHLLKAFVKLLRRSPTLRLELDTGQGPRPVRAKSLTVANNRYSDESGFPPRRERLDTGMLAVYITRPRTKPQLLQLVLGLLRGKWLSSPRVEMVEATHVTVASRSSRDLALVTDGELHREPSPLRFEIHPRSCLVLMPRRESARQAA